MVYSSAILGMVALASAYLAAPAAGQVKKPEGTKPLPWEGFGKDLTLKTIDSKYLLHILTMRNKPAYNNVSRYVTIEQEGRSPAYNRDTGIINIAVDEFAMFKEQNNFRRSELVQNVESNEEGTTFFRGSLRKTEKFYNEYVWQCLFDESHIFEIRVDATVTPHKIIYINNGTWDAKWEAEFEFKTWYNFGFGISKAAKGNGSVVTFYTSTGDDDLKQERNDTVVSAFPTFHEFHIGLLTLTDDKTDPVMDPKQDIISFNGVSVEANVVTSATGVASAAGSVADKSSYAPSPTTGAASAAGSTVDNTYAPSPTTEVGGSKSSRCNRK